MFDNDFTGSLISAKFSELSSLTHLDLSYSIFTGIIPAEISLLSKYMFFVWRVIIQNEHRFEADNFELLLKNLTRLRELYLIFVNISSTIPLNLSSYLTILSLDNTELYRTLPEGAFHLSILEYLYSSYNPQLPIMFPTIKWNTSASLMELDLSGLNATGKISDHLVI